MTKNVGVRSEDHDGRDRVTKNVGDIGARSEHCDSDQKRRRRRSRVREMSEQNMIPDNSACQHDVDYCE